MLLLLEPWYESQIDPCKAYLVDKFIALRNTDASSMDVYLTQVRNIANILEEVNVALLDHLIVHYALKFFLNITRLYVTC